LLIEINVLYFLWLRFLTGKLVLRMVMHARHAKDDLIHLLFLGVDLHDGDKGHSDTHPFINPRTNSIIMISLPTQNE